MVKNDPKMTGVSSSRDQDELRARAAGSLALSCSAMLRDMTAMLRGMTKDVMEVAEQQEAKNRHE